MTEYLCPNHPLSSRGRDSHFVREGQAVCVFRQEISAQFKTLVMSKKGQYLLHLSCAYTSAYFLFFKNGVELFIAVHPRPTPRSMVYQQDQTPARWSGRFTRGTEMVRSSPTFLPLVPSEGWHQNDLLVTDAKASHFIFLQMDLGAPN